jgi:hypothetical protein
MHRYEQVDQPSNKAVTLAFRTSGGKDRGEVTGPTKIILGQQIVERTPQPGSLTPTKAFAMAEELADQWVFPSWWSIQMAFGTGLGVNSTVPLGPALAARSRSRNACA